MARRELIDLVAVMDNIPTIMGLDLTRKGDKWQGGYYMDRTKHPYRRDKLKVTIWNYNIWVHEEGNRSLSLVNWLQQYGGAADYKEAYRIMRGNAIPLPPVARERERVEGRYVSEEVFAEYCQYDLGRCNLFTWMCRMFGQTKVMEAWAKYDVTSDNEGNVVWWYRDAEGRLLHDKVMRYNAIGKRDKTFTTRRFKTADGFSGRCYWGAHLIEEGKKVVLLESEKSVLLCACYFGMDKDMVFLATGGKGNTRDIDENTILLPDMDAISDWSNTKGVICEWWNLFDVEIGEKDDIGDAIVKQLRKNGNKVELI